MIACEKREGFAQAVGVQDALQLVSDETSKLSAPSMASPGRRAPIGLEHTVVHITHSARRGRIGGSGAGRSPAGRPASAGVPDTRGDGVDRELDPAPNEWVLVTGTKSPQQVDLHHVQRVEIGVPVEEAPREQAVVGERVR